MKKLLLGVAVILSIFSASGQETEKPNLERGKDLLIAPATQCSDNWTMMDMYEAYLGKKPANPPILNRGEWGELKKALRSADMERRLFEAEKLIKEHKKDN